MGDQTLYLRWSDHHLTILRLLSIIRDKEQYCDATIMCEGRVFPVHRIVLAMCSSYFENIFNKLDCKNPVIVLADIKAAYLEVLLSYMYSGEATILQRCVSGVLHTASVLKVKGLSEDADDHTDVNLYGEAIPNIQYNQKLSTKNTVLSVQQEKECRNGSADFDSQPAASKQMRQTELSRQTVSSFLVREGTPEINENSEGSLTHSSTLSIVPDSEISLVQSNLVSQNLGELLSLNSVKGDSCHEALMLWRENLLSQDSTHERQTSNTDSAMDHSNKSIVEEIDIKNEIIELLPEECNVNGVGNSMNIDCLHCTRTYSSNQGNDMEGICTSRDQNNIPVAATFQDNRVSQNISPGDVCQTEVVRAVLKQELSGTCIVNGHEDNDVGVAKNSMVVCNGGIASNNSRNLQDPEECYSFPSMTTEDNMEPDDTANCSNCQEHKNGHQSCPEITINNDHNNTALGVSHRAPIDNIFTKSKKNSDANALKSLSGTNHTPEPVKRRRGRPRKLPMVKNEKSGRWAKIVPVVKKERVQPRMVLAVKERGRTKKLETVLSAASSRCIEIHKSRIKNVDLRENADQQFRRETSHRLTRSSTSSKKVLCIYSCVFLIVY
ncbi:hypothetical protein OTU49_003181 [Cherax quadricarinatus]|uniref:BTB domain-containing protein n=1 Tax=Cherax quadricarinatus TaxID=27406 RepID=A0AAW0X9M1_CHEQU